MMTISAWTFFSAISAAFFIGGVVFMTFDRWCRSDKDQPEGSE